MAGGGRRSREARDGGLNAMLLELCHSEGMVKAKVSKPARSRSTDWQVGQPLVFPKVKAQQNFERLARQAVEEGIGGPLKTKRPKKIKK